MVQRSECLYDDEIIGIESIYTVIDGKQINIPEKVEALRKLGRDGLLKCTCGCGTKLILVASDRGLRQQHFRAMNGESWSECTLKQEGKNSIDSKVVIKCWLADKIEQNIKTRVPINRISDTDRKYEVSHYVPDKDFAVNYTNLRVNLEDEKLDALEGAFGDRILHIVDKENKENFTQYPEFMNKIQKKQRYCLFLQIEEGDYDKAMMFSSFYEKDVDGFFEKVDLTEGLLKDYSFNDNCELLFEGKPVSEIYDEKHSDFLKEQEQEKRRRAETLRKLQEEQERCRIEREKREAERKAAEKKRLDQNAGYFSSHNTNRIDSDELSGMDLRTDIGSDKQNSLSVSNDPINIKEKAELEIDHYIDKPYVDSKGNRWFKCTECSKVGTRDQFADIANARGTCKECYKRIHGDSESKGEGIFGNLEIKRNYDSNTCPWCGSQLKKINGKFGPFLGCTSYPRCTYRRKINL